MRVGAFELEEPLPELREPHALAMLRPWVDVGNVGSLTLGYLEEDLHAQPLAKLTRPGNFFDFTRYRPTIYFKEGQREISIPNTYIHWAKGEENNDFLFLHLLEPHMLGEDYVDSLSGILETFGVKRYCLLGSMYDAVPHTRPLIVSGSASGDETARLLKSLGVQSSGYEGPTSIASLVSHRASLQNIETMGLIVHLTQYAQLEEDYGGQLRIVEIVSSLYHLSIDLAHLREKTRRQYDEIGLAVEKNSQLRNIVAQLERHYEARVKKEEEEKEKPSLLSPEIEKFLREIDKDFGQ
ncbi:MAG: PAC2 family protein [Chloroflexi bacterium]|nr:PAC2 family protein [Chloroflexota bacterium]